MSFTIEDRHSEIDKSKRIQRDDGTYPYMSFEMLDKIATTIKTSITDTFREYVLDMDDLAFNIKSTDNEIIVDYKVVNTSGPVLGFLGYYIDLDSGYILLNMEKSREFIPLVNFYKLLEERTGLPSNKELMTSLIERFKIGDMGIQEFEEEFKRLKNKASSNSYKFAILFLDIDEFKRINDNYGHNIGDLVLKKIAVRLKSNLKSKDCLARLGGDEFVIIIADIESKKEAAEIGSRVVEVFEQPILVEGQQIEVSISGGISIYPENGEELEQLIKNADYAMYQAKRGEKDLEVKKPKEGDEN